MPAGGRDARVAGDSVKNHAGGAKLFSDGVHFQSQRFQCDNPEDTGVSLFTKNDLGDGITAVEVKASFSDGALHGAAIRELKNNLLPWLHAQLPQQFGRYDTVERTRVYEQLALLADCGAPDGFQRHLNIHKAHSNLSAGAVSSP